MEVDRNNDRKRILLGYVLVVCAIGSLCAALTYRSEFETAEVCYLLDDRQQTRLQIMLSREQSVSEIKGLLEEVSAKGRSAEMTKPLAIVDQLLADMKIQRSSIQAENPLEHPK